MKCKLTRTHENEISRTRKEMERDENDPIYHLVLSRHYSTQILSKWPLWTGTYNSSLPASVHN